MDPPEIGSNAMEWHNSRCQDTFDWIYHEYFQNDKFDKAFTECEKVLNDISLPLSFYWTLCFALISIRSQVFSDYGGIGGHRIALYRLHQAQQQYCLARIDPNTNTNASAEIWNVFGEEIEELRDWFTDEEEPEQPPPQYHGNFFGYNNSNVHQLSNDQLLSQLHQPIIHSAHALRAIVDDDDDDDPFVDRHIVTPHPLRQHQQSQQPQGVISVPVIIRPLPTAQSESPRSLRRIQGSHQLRGGDT